MPISLATAALGPPSVQTSDKAGFCLDQSLESGWNQEGCVASYPWRVHRAHRQSRLPAQESLHHPNESEAVLVGQVPGASAQFEPLEIHEGVEPECLSDVWGSSCPVRFADRQFVHHQD